MSTCSEKAASQWCDCSALGVCITRALTCVLALSQPWAEGYIYLSPGTGTTATQSLNCDKILDSSLMSAADRLSFLTGTQQMNIIRQDMFRAGVRDIVLKDNNFDGKILYYVMSHYPGQATSSWRRLFYGALAHGMKTLDLYEFHSSWHATENYVDVEGGSYENVLAAMHELGQFEDMCAVAASVYMPCLTLSALFCRAY